VLIVLPFTAPFQTIDLSARHGTAPARDLLSSDKLSKDAATPALTEDVVPFSFSTAIPAESLNGRQQRRHVLPAVLRL
jgi:hypothetical protein